MKTETLTFTEPKKLQLNPDGYKLQVSAGRFVADYYIGKFTNPDLQAKAETGLWYARAMGTGLQLTGEGETAEKAVDDLCERAEEMRAELARVFAL